MASANSASPANLYRASIERIDAADLCWRQARWVEAMYLGGLAVECLLQAFALRDQQVFDARHDLAIWLMKAPARLQAVIRQPPLSADWSRLEGEWSNRMRYWDYAALLGFARHMIRFRRYKGDDEDRMKRFVAEFLESARRVQHQGLRLW